MIVTDDMVDRLIIPTVIYDPEMDSCTKLTGENEHCDEPILL